MSDALEMRAISGTVGVEEGAVQRSPPGPTRCASATTSSTSRLRAFVTRSSLRCARDG